MKTEAERAASRQKQAPQQPTKIVVEQPVNDDTHNVSVPAPSGSRTVILAMLISFGIFALAGNAAYVKLSRLQGYLAKTPSPASTTNATTASVEMGSGGAGGLPSFSVFSARSIFGWMALSTMLLILSDFDATSELAKSFALLIMFTTLLTLGPDAFANIGKLTSGASK